MFITSRTLLRAGFLFAALIASAARILNAQSDTVRIPYTPTCSVCKVVFDLVGEAGNEQDPELIASRPLLARDRFGRMYATGYLNTSVIVFDSTGRFLRTIGRQGLGPGEFGTTVYFMNMVGDSLVVTGESGTMVVYSPASPRFEPLVPGSGTNILHVDERNRLWIATGIAFRPSEQPRGVVADCRMQLKKSVEGWTTCARIDVIDPTTRKLIVTQLMETGLNHLSGTDLFYRIAQSATGVVHVSMYRARLIE